MAGDHVVPFHVYLITPIKLLECYSVLHDFFSISSTVGKTESFFLSMTRNESMVPVKTSPSPFIRFSCDSS